MEDKKITWMFAEKVHPFYGPVHLYELMSSIEKDIQACADKIGETELSGLSYRSQSAEIAEVIEEQGKLNAYILSAHGEVEQELDRPLWLHVKNHAAETMSQIKAERITTENTIGLEEHVQLKTHGEDIRYKRSKERLSISDFMLDDSIEKGEEWPVLCEVGGMKEFHALYQLEYDIMKELNGEIGTPSEYRKELLEGGQFDHKAYHPVKDFISGLLDLTIIKPLIEACIGTDLVTGEELTDLERGLKAVFAVVDVVTLGSAMAITKGMNLTGKELLKAMGKVAVVEAASNGAGYTVGYLAAELGLPMPITLLLAGGSGMVVSKVGIKHAFGDADSIIKVLNSGSGSYLDEMTEATTKGVGKVDDLAETAIKGPGDTFDDWLKGMPPKERALYLENSDKRAARQGLSDWEYSKLIEEVYYAGKMNQGDYRGFDYSAFEGPGEIPKTNFEAEIPRSADEWLDDFKAKYGEGNVTKNFTATPELENHITKIDTSVPVKRGIGGAHNEVEFFKNDVQIVNSTPSSTVPGVMQVEYNMPKLDGSTYPATPVPGEYGTSVFKKTIYDPSVISDGEFVRRGLEAANNAMLPDGSLPGVWSGLDSSGVEWTGYFRNGKIDSFFPSN